MLSWLKTRLTSPKGKSLNKFFVQIFSKENLESISLSSAGFSSSLESDWQAIKEKVRNIINVAISFLLKKFISQKII